MKSTFDVLQKLKKAWLENDSAINQLRNSQIEIRNSMEDINAEIADQAIDALKKAYEIQQDIEVKTIESRMNAEDERHQRVMDNIDAEIQKLQEKKDAEDYNKSLAKSQSEIQDIQNQINVISLDDSLEAKAKRTKLLQELSDKQESLANMQNDHELELRQKNLENQKEIETDKYNTVKLSLEHEKQDREYYWNEMLNDEQNFANQRQLIIDGNVEGIKNKLSSFLSEFKSMNEETAQSIGLSWASVQNGISSINVASGQLANVSNSVQKNKPTVPVRPGSADEAILRAQYGDKIDIVYSNNVGDLAGEDRVETNQKYQDALSNMGITPSGSIDDIWKYKSSFASGGYTGDWSSGDGKLAVLHSKELVLNAVDTSNILKAVDITRNFMNNFKIPSLPSFTPSLAGGANLTVSPTIQFNVTGGDLSTNELNKISDYVNKQIVIGLKKIGL
jgi:hypothetical protein